MLLFDTWSTENHRLSKMESVLPLRDFSFVNSSGDQQQLGKGSRSLIRSHAMREVRRRQALQSKSKHAARGKHKPMPSRSKALDQTITPYNWSSDPCLLPSRKPLDHRRTKPASNIKVRRDCEKIVPAAVPEPTYEPNGHRLRATQRRGMPGFVSAMAITALSADGKIDPFDVSQVTLRLPKQKYETWTVTPRFKLHI